MSAPSMPCSKCSGTGKVPLPPEYEKTLACLGKGYVTASEVHHRMGGRGPATAANNRLEYLRRLGLVVRIPTGRRQWGYLLPDTKASKRAKAVAP